MKGDAKKGKQKHSHERTGIAKSGKKKKNVNQEKKQAVIRNEVKLASRRRHKANYFRR